MIELILLIVSITLLYILLPIISIFVFIKLVLKGEWKYARVWMCATSKEIDKFGNFVGAPVFNQFFITKGGYQFGKRIETISSVLGKNQRDGTLSRPGKLLAAILDFIEEDHCKLSIDDTITNTRK